MSPFSVLQPPWRSELGRHNTRPLTASALLPQLRFTNGLAGSYKVNGGAHVMDTSTANLANRVQEFGEAASPIASADIEEGMVGRYDNFPTIIEGWWAMDGIRQTGAAAGDCFVGFEVGSLGVDTPFPAAPAHPVYQVRFHRVTNDVVLYVARGGGAVNATSVRCNLAGGLNGNMNGPIRVRLEILPTVYARLTVGDQFDGVPKVAEITDPAKLPPVPSGYVSGFAFILCTGSAAGGLQFSASNFQLHTMTSGWNL